MWKSQNSEQENQNQEKEELLIALLSLYKQLTICNKEKKIFSSNQSKVNK